MDRARREQASEIFQDAIEQPIDGRAAYLDAVCNGDPELRAEVESLLAALPKAEALFQSALANDLADTARTLGEHELGRRIGDYRLVRVLARGGMGTVYLAESADPELRMQVAIKLVRPGLATADILRRFLAERQLLAELNHPHIARLLGGGATADGLPYLVMEYVDGMPLDRYCSANHVTIEGRLELVRTVCSAVQYAHRHLIVHRDLKPSNIFVNRDGQVKLLDFGIAKVLAPEGIDGAGVGGSRGDRTLTSLRALTPRYASPEQVRGERPTTATDVYSLGVVLYELLTGQAPYDLDQVSPAEVERIVCQQDIQPPSVAVRRREADAGTQAAPPAGAQAAPSAGAQSLARRLSGDLDTIVLQALRKEPDLRYASVEELSADIERHLQGLPLRARSDSFGYRLAKFVRRNRALIAIAAAVAVLLVASVAVHLVLAAGIALILVASAVSSFLLYRRADRERRIAEERTREVEWLAYTSSLAAAQGAVLAHRTSEARHDLERAPAALRGWEWRHLWGRTDRSEAIIEKHRFRVTAIDVSRDGKLVLSASMDKTAVLWELETGRTRHVFAHEDWVEGAGLSPDGRYVVTASRDQVIALWRAATGEQVARVQAASGPSTLAIAPDNRIAVGLRDGSLLIVTPPALEVVAEWPAHESGVSCVAFTPDGTLLATGSWDGDVTLWTAADAAGAARATAATAQRAGGWHGLRSFKAHRGRVVRIDWSPDGTRLATGSADTKATVWDASTGEALVTYHGFEGMVGAVLFDPSGRRVLAGDSDGRVVTFDAVNGERMSVLRGSAERTLYTAVRLPGDTRFLAGAVNGGVHVTRWSADDVRWLISDAPAPERNYVLQAAPSPDGTLIATASRTSGVDLWDAQDGERLHHIHLPSVTGPPSGTADAGMVIGTVTGTAAGPATGCSCVAFDPSGTKLYVADAAGRLAVIKIDSSSRPMREPEIEYLLDDMHPEGAGSGPANIDQADGNLTIRALDVHPAGTLVASASTDGTIKLWSPGERGRLRHTLSGHESVVTAVKFDPEGRVLASASGDRTIRLWEIESGREIGVLRGHTERVLDLAWSPDGRRLVSASHDRTVRLWDSERMHSLGILIEHKTAIMMAVAYSHDGSRIAAGGVDKAIWLVDPIRRRDVVRLQGHVGRIRSLRFGPNDRLLVSASIDGTTGVWDVPAGES